MLSIGTNAGALNAAKGLNGIVKRMETAMLRLSTGKRINSAADDAGGLSVSIKLNAEIMGVNQSIKNASDAASLLSTVEGALQEVHTHLLRMREIAVQASSQSLSDSDRDSLQSEVGALEADIQRIADDTSFAGQVLLAGGFSTGITFQVGPRRGNNLHVSIGAINATTTIANGGLDLNEDVTTSARAMGYISNIDAAISHISSNRGTYGAAINRLEHTIANLENISANLMTARGAIEDADFAAETSNFAREQILQQAAIAMLSQANASKQNVLALFQ